MIGDPEYDAAFRIAILCVAAEPPAVCQRCGVEYGAHAIANYLGDLTHHFEELSRN